MKTLIKTLALATLIIGAAGTAQAQAQAQPEKKITVEINIDRSAPAAKTYSKIKKATRQSCRKAYRKMSVVSTRTKATRACRKLMTSLAVEQINMPTLIAFHNERTGERLAFRQYASRK